ncbi:MAG TPA: diacylglycerol kinase family protein [Solirubrobacterales bacterium]|nr:diacylglycerol kinase family protein [Solirubrobacterales bacterium]
MISAESQRTYAARTAILSTIFALGLAIDFLVDRSPGALIPLGLLTLAIVLVWLALVSIPARRLSALLGSLIALVLAVAYVVRFGDPLGQVLVIVALLALASVAIRRAFSVEVPLPSAEAPSSAVLFYNPKSGGGKADEFSLAKEAETRGMRAVELSPGDDLEQLVRAAVAEGADGLAMAGGDGSQAIVAKIAAELDLPYACVPAGTRNHFALDLGVDREDVVGSLDAFVEGGERRVDLAEVNGTVFVNNVSLGVYAEAVQQDSYRDAKVRTLLETASKVMGPDGDGPRLEWRSPSGRRHHSGAAILVSNNRYRLGAGVGSGTRPTIEDGLLGIVVLADPSAGGRRLRRFQKPWREWSAREFEVGSDGPVAAGIDGEAAQLSPPLTFGIRPGVLRARIARGHPGASPSAGIPEGAGAVLQALMRIALRS